MSVSVVETPVTPQPKSFKTKFWPKRQSSTVSSITAQTEEPVSAKKGAKLPTLFMPPILNHGRQSNKNLQLYKLSTINDSGIYMPPSPAEEESDQWVNSDEGYFDFHLPSPDRLTVQHGANKNTAFNFYTPSMVAFDNNKSKRMTWAGPTSQQPQNDDDQSVCSTSSLPTEATTPVDASIVLDKKDTGAFVPKFGQWEEATLVAA
ncbi:hypothetical protein VKS41_000755 [Umbelopsis sp. WA50703]|jgi:hypothetical protein